MEINVKHHQGDILYRNLKHEKRHRTLFYKCVCEILKNSKICHDRSWNHVIDPSKHFGDPESLHILDQGIKHDQS